MDSCGMCGVFQPALFENIVSETVQHLHEVVVLNKPGEPEVNKCFASRFASCIDHAESAYCVCVLIYKYFAFCWDYYSIYTGNLLLWNTMPHFMCMYIFYLTCGIKDID